MSLPDMMQYFGTVFTAYYKEGYEYVAQQVRNRKKNSVYFTFDVPQEGEYFIGIHQPSARHFKDSNPNYKYSPIRALLGRQTQQGYEFVDSKSDNLYDAVVGKKIPAGRYVVAVKVTWNY